MLGIWGWLIWMYISVNINCTEKKKTLISTPYEYINLIGYYMIDTDSDFVCMANWTVKKTKNSTAWVKWWSISNKNRNDFKVLLSLFMWIHVLCALLIQHWQEPTHSLPANTVLSHHLTSSMVLFHTALDFTRTPLALVLCITLQSLPLVDLPFTCHHLHSDDKNSDHRSNNDIKWRKYSTCLHLIQCPSVPLSPNETMHQLSLLPPEFSPSALPRSSSFFNAHSGFIWGEKLPRRLFTSVLSINITLR